MRLFTINALLATTAIARPIAFSDTTETVTIITENGRVRINASDYNPDEHTLADAANGEAAPAGDITDDEADAITPPAPLMQPETNVATGAGAPAAQIAPTSAVDANGNPIVAEPAQRLVSKIGAKFFIVDAAGNKLTGDGINAKGYADEASAWSAIVALTAPPAA